MSDYFSDREYGQQAQTSETMTREAWGGIVALVSGLVSGGSFGSSFPAERPDGGAVFGTDSRAFALAARAEIPGLALPLQADTVLESDNSIESEAATLAALDFVEFCHANVAQAIQGYYHSYFGHHHLGFDQEAGKSTFREKVNRILARNRMAFELDQGGSVRRLIPPPMRVLWSSMLPPTGDAVLDELLATSQHKFADPDLTVRKEALEKLWGAWERLKSIEDTDKQRSVDLLLAYAAADESFRSLLNEEASKLTRIGNSFQIRHSETNQTLLTEPAHIDYLYARLFTLIHLLITTREREAPR